jgi:hypothetical protein
METGAWRVDRGTAADGNLGKLRRIRGPWASPWAAVAGKLTAPEVSCLG